MLRFWVLRDLIDLGLILISVFVFVGGMELWVSCVSD